MAVSRSLISRLEPIERIFIGSILGVFLILLIAELINGRFWMNDLRVYWEAARAFRSGDPVYGPAFGLSSGHFKYAPLVLLALVPLSFIPFNSLAIAYYVLLAGAAVSSILLAVRLAAFGPMPKKRRYLLFFLSALVIMVHWHRELHLGNVNLVLLLFALLAIRAIASMQFRLAGVLLGTCILVKPHFVIILPLLAYFGHWRCLGSAVATAAIGMLLPLLIVGVENGVTLTNDWIDIMRTHNTALIYAGGADRESMNTLFTVVHRYLLCGIAGPSSTTAYATLVVAATAVIWLLLRIKRRVTANDRVLLFFVALAAIPSLTVTDTNHFLFSGPLIVILLGQLIMGKAARYLRVLILAGLVLHGANWHDLLGPLSDRMANASMLGLGNLLLIAAGLLLLYPSHQLVRDARPA